MIDDRLVYEVLAVVGEIPAGRVATYGQIARLVGCPKNSRLVGNILKYSDQYGEYPCHRVVDHAGRLAPLFHAQRSLLEAEGVRFGRRGRVRMKEYQWDA